MCCRSRGGVAALDANTGRMNAADTFQTVNGVPAKGGSLAETGPSIANGMLYLGAGYIGVQGGSPGDVLLAFSVQ